MKKLFYFFLISLFLAAPLGCGGEENNAPEGAGLQGMDDAQSFAPPPDTSSAPANTATP